MAHPPEQSRGDASEFINKLVKDPKNPPKTLQVTGYIGAAGEPGRTRIYLDTSLRNYVEVPEDKVLHVQSANDQALAPSIIWLAADAPIFTPDPPQMEARGYFGGDIYRDYLGHTPHASPAPEAFPIASLACHVSLQVVCAPSRVLDCTLGCPTVAAACLSIACVTREIPYCSYVCATREYICPTLEYVCPTREVAICYAEASPQAALRFHPPPTKFCETAYYCPPGFTHSPCSAFGPCF